MDNAPLDAFLAEHRDYSLVKPLTGGLSGSGVYEVMSGQCLQVLKLQQDTTELAFYTKIADKYFANQSWLPKIYDHGNLDAYNWLLIEHIPNPWPRERYSFDPKALAVLRELHETRLDPNEMLWPDKTWTQEQLSVSKTYLPDRTNEQLDRVFEAYHRRRPLNSVLCSGDANAPNWLIRDDGSIVLIDWQQVSHDNRALDIAGWIATLLSFDEIVRVASLYLKDGSKDAIVELANDIVIFFARRCATNFWRAETSDHRELWQESVDRLRVDFPIWPDKAILNLP